MNKGYVGEIQRESSMVFTVCQILRNAYLLTTLTFRWNGFSNLIWKIEWDKLRKYLHCSD